MKSAFGKIAAMFLSAAALLSVCGCRSDVPYAGQSSQEPAYSQPIQLRILVEAGENSAGGITYLSDTRKAIAKIMEDFTAKHSTVNFQVEDLPGDPQEREPVLQRIRAEIMAGKGPDIFLLPAKTLSGSLDPLYLEPLIQDVNQNMYSKKFLDISRYYVEDETLDKAGLNQSVMDGGCVGDARYVLPLRYTVPVALVHTPSLEKRGIDPAALSSTMEGFFSTLVAHGDSSISPQFQGTFFCAFPAIYDYEKEKVALDKEQMTSFFTAYRDYTALSASCEVFLPVGLMKVSVDEETPILSDNLGQTVMDLAVLSKLNGEKTEVIPLNTADGTLAANVTFWGAVGAACEHPQEAYDFLSQFLSPELQSDQKLFPIVSELAWPVRTNGFAAALWDAYRNEHKADLSKEIFETEVSDEDFPILQAEIGSVRFETDWDSDIDMLLRSRLYDWDAMKPSTESADAIAQDILDELRWRIQE